MHIFVWNESQFYCSAALIVLLWQIGILQKKKKIHLINSEIWKKDSDNI